MTHMSKTILIVEDSRTQARIVAGLFQRHGLGTELAVSRMEALACLKRRSYFMLLLDVFVGDDNMLDHLDDIRRLAPNTPIAVMTAGQRDKPMAASQALNLARRNDVDFLLPKPFDANDIRQICDDARRGRRRMRSQRILIIDDDSYLRTLIHAHLEEDGFQVAEAASVEEALMRLDVTHVDAVIIDIVMPGIGGLAGIRIIRSTWPRVPVIAITGYSKNTDHLQNAMLKGAAATLAKPFQKQQLIDTLTRCIAGGDDGGDNAIFV